MSNINVNPDITDQFYRYKMPRIQTKIEGKGNGIKTVVTNLSQIAQSLARPGSYLIKYFGFELGAQTNNDPKDDRWIINGSHDNKKLQDLVYGFITKFVLCKKCKNPETVVIIKDERIIFDCKACGQRGEADLRLKLSGFILKNQPKKGKKDKAERKAARAAKQQAAKEGSGSGNDDASDHASGDGATAADDDGDASDQEFQNMKSTVNAATEDIQVKDDEWAVDMSEAAVKARQAQLPSEFKAKMTLGDDEDEDGEGGGNSIYDEFGQWVLDQGTETEGGIPAVDSVDIYVKAKELGIAKKHRTVLVLAQTLFTTDNIVEQIPKRSSMLAQLIGESDKHMKALLGGTERLIGTKSKETPDVVSIVVKVLQLYYMKDLVSEEVVTKWGNTASKKYIDLPTSKRVRKAAKPFLTWLEEAEEESDEESDDE